jgi:hypothetical protein
MLFGLLSINIYFLIIHFYPFSFSISMGLFFKFTIPSLESIKNQNIVTFYIYMNTASDRQISTLLNGYISAKDMV